MGEAYLVADILKRIKRPVHLNDNQKYKLITIKLNHKGVVLRESKRGREIKSNVYEVKEGDFILSGIDARNGAFGIVPPELDGALVTNDFWYFQINEEIISKVLFLELTATSWFDEICKRGSDGTTQRVRLQKDKFFNQRLLLPKREEQEGILDRLLSKKTHWLELRKEIDHQKTLLSKLKHAIIQEAIEGKLTADWREQNLDIEPANELLKRIKVEKEQLIKVGKIKKGRPLPPISKNEIPFVAPKGWIWCRLGEITTYGSSEKAEPNEISPDTWVLDLEDIEKESSIIIRRKTFKERVSSSTKSVFQKGWVLYSKLRPYLDKVVVADNDGVCTTEILPLPIYSNLNPMFLMLGLKGKHFIKYANSKVGGMKMPRLGTEEGRMALIPLAPVAEQELICEKVKKLEVKALLLEGQLRKSEYHS